MTDDDSTRPTIRVVAACTTDTDGRFLLVRKAGTDIFMQPGGKPEPGEEPAAALVRELSEELGLTIAPELLRPWRQFTADAANEPGHHLVAQVFGLRWDGEFSAAAEIAEARWFSYGEAIALGDRLAPLARQLLDLAPGLMAFNPFHFTAPIETDRLRLRPMTVGDIDAVHSYQSRADVCEMLLFEPRTRVQVGESVGRHSQRLSLVQDDDYLQIAVERRSDGRLLGDVYFRLRSVENLTAEIGWTFHPDHHGQGYATEAAGAVLGLAFRQLGLHRVYAELDPRNEASVALCRRIGLREEALYRQDLWFKGAWADTGVHAILRSDWESQRAR